MITEEQWRDIKGFEGLYQVSSKGRVRSVTRMVQDSSGRMRMFPGKMMKIRHSQKIGLRKGGKEFMLFVEEERRKVFQ